MNKIHRTLTKLFLLCALTLLTGCQPVNNIQEAAATATPVTQTLPTVVENLYPATPEEVIRAFLIAYPTDQIYAVQYLSPTYVKELDTASVANLLPDSGDITGFIIKSGSTSVEDEKSEILADLAFQNSSSEVLFNLEIVDGRWAINKITPK